MQSRRFGMNHLLGVLVVAIGGVVTVPVLDWAARMLTARGVLLVLIVVALLAGVGAGLLRTWWALLAVPVVYFLGYEVGAGVEAAVRGSLYTLEYALQYLLLGAGVFVYTFLLPLLLGAAIGTAVAQWMAHRHRVGPVDR